MTGLGMEDRFEGEASPDPGRSKSSRAPRRTTPGTLSRSHLSSALESRSARRSVFQEASSLESNSTSSTNAPFALSHWDPLGSPIPTLPQAYRSATGYLISNTADYLCLLELTVRIAILSRGPKLYSTRRLKEAAEARGKRHA